MHSLLSGLNFVQIWALVILNPLSTVMRSTVAPLMQTILHCPRKLYSVAPMSAGDSIDFYKIHLHRPFSYNRNLLGMLSEVL